MGYQEMRLQREVQQLKRAVQNNKNEERQTREGCMELVHALREIIKGLEGTNPAASSKTTALVDQAGALFSPASEAE